MSDPVYIDWDISFRGWHSHAFRAKAEVRKVPGGTMVHRAVRSKPWVETRVRAWTKAQESRLLTSQMRFRVWYRQSAGGRVHLALDWPKHIDIGMANRYLLRYMLLDDPQRLDSDFIREAQGERVNRLFDSKFKAGKIGHAGPWHYWFTVR